MLDAEKGPAGSFFGLATPLPALWGHRDTWGRGDPQPGRARSTLEPLPCPEGNAALAMCKPPQSCSGLSSSPF